MREISIEGAPKIGEGACGTVYRIADDTIAKVYRPFVTMEAIRREKALSRWAFVNGVPTAISFDIVRIGENYGVVYELLNGRSASEYIRESDENLEIFIRKSVELMNVIHEVSVKPGELPDMKKNYRSWIETCRLYLPAGLCDRLRKLLERVPDRNTLLHGDYHLKNIMISGDDLMLIDMDTLCYGDPIFELATIYNSYKEFPSIAQEAAAFLGIDVPTAFHIWDRTLELYSAGANAETASETMIKAKIFGCIRIIDYMHRNKDLPDREKCIRTSARDIAEAMKDYFPDDCGK